MKKIDEDYKQLRLTNKPFKDMTLEELYTERSCHQWHRSKMKWHIESLKKRKWWLEQNRPILSKEEITAKYENGEMSFNQYKTAFASRKRAIDHRLQVEQRMIYADLVAYDEESLVIYLDELIAEKLSKKPQPTEENKFKKRDPRKRATPGNQRKWETIIDPRRMPKLKEARKRWKAYRVNDVETVLPTRGYQPITQWDLDKLKLIARDRGYFTDTAMTAVIADAFDISIKATTELLHNGRLSWGQCAVIGAIFEMSPKEYCDVFMSGYFREVADGVYKAYIDDIPSFVTNLRAKRKWGASVSEEMTESEGENDEE